MTEKRSGLIAVLAAFRAKNVRGAGLYPQHLPNRNTDAGLAQPDCVNLPLMDRFSDGGVTDSPAVGQLGNREHGLFFHAP